MKSKKQEAEIIIPEMNLQKRNSFFSLENIFLQCSIILLIAIIFYGNTLYNGFALDDGLVWKDNAFVKKGFAGIGDILFHDSFYGALGHGYNLAGGRWRPLSLITFAIEHQIWGESWWHSHLINLLLYALSGMLLLHLLRKYILPNKPLLSFAAVLLFMIHPIHTEAIANIKSRDEILSLLFLMLALLFSLDVANGKRTKPALIISGLFFFLALLSKENGLMFLFIAPLTLYFFSNASVKEIIIYSLPYFVITALYIFLRTSIVPFTNEEVKELMDNPYLLATTQQKFATIFYVFIYYFRLFFFPHPLTYDYSYNQIAYKEFSDVAVIFSVVLHAALIIYALMNLRSKNVLAYCILFYLSSIFMVSNLLLNIGAPLAERFLYQPSIVLCVFIVVVVQHIFSKANLNESLQKNISVVLIILLTIPAAYKTITRNQVWINGPTLGTTDVNVSTHSARANTYAAANYISLYDSAKTEVQKKIFLQKAIDYCYISQSIYPDFYVNYMFWGFAYSKLDSLDKAVWAWKHGQQLQPSSEYVNKNLKVIADKFFEIGMNYGGTKSYDTSIIYLRKAIDTYKGDAEYFYNLGGAYFMTNKLDSAEINFSAALKLNPNHTQARQGLDAVLTQKKLRNEK